LNADCGQICRGNGPATSTSTPLIRQSLRKLAFEITSTVNYTQNENLTLARLIEDQVFGETCDRHAAGATKFVCREATAWPNSRTLSNPQQRSSDRLFPTLRQTPICLSFVPIRLLQNICNRCITESNPRFFHARRARSRSAEINPFLRIWLIDTSIFGPFAAASSSCSRLVIRRSFSWRINSGMYSDVVPQSQVDTWVFTYI